MANLQTSANILAHIKDRAGVTSADNEWTTLAIESLNTALWSMLLGGLEFNPKDSVIFPWAVSKNPLIITLQPVITTGTVTATNNSTSITFSSAPSNSVTDYFFRVDGESDIYRISAHTAGQTTATLDSVFTGTTTSTGTYKLMPLRYTVGSTDVHALVSPLRTYRFTLNDTNEEGEISLEYGEVGQPWPRRDISQATPSRANVIYQTNTGEVVLEFNSYTDELVRVEAFYIPIPTDLADDSTEPPVPRMYRNVLAEMALYFMYAAKGDNRQADQLQVAQRALQGMINFYKRQQLAGSRTAAQLLPRKDDLNSIRGPLRTDSGLIIG